MSSSAPAISAPVQSRIERVAQAIAEQVEADDGDADDDAAEHREIGVAAQCRQPVADHAAPARCRLLHAKAQEAQRRFGHDDEADSNGGADQQRRGNIRQDMAPKNFQPPGAADDCGIDIELLLLHQHERACQPGDPWPPDQGQGHMTVVIPVPMTAASRIARTTSGNASTMSTVRMMMLSAMPPRKPAMPPSTTPTHSVIASTDDATSNDTRAPMMSRLAMSRPRRSVPSGLTRSGGATCSAGRSHRTDAAPAAARAPR